ncbi:MAG: VTT domain-containing protein [Verrucomicrobiales bacterium]|nr:VTT domain-containing protein [Verrucomicrobiales bacterium]
MKLNSKVLIRVAVAVIVVALAVFLAVKYGDQLDLKNLVAKETALEAYKEKNLGLFALGGFALYVVVTALSIPGAGILSIVLGRFLGLGLGFVVVSFASTLGATLAFLVSRFVLGDTIREKYGEKLKEINRKLEKEGPFYLFTMRLIPAFPFFLINLLMGLTPIKVWTFWWVSQVGMLAGTFVYVYAGSQIPSLAELSKTGIKGILSPGLIIAFVALGIFPFLVRAIMSKFRPKESQSGA